MKILIADDEKSIVLTLEDDLADAGHQVFTAADGNRALETIRREEIDVLVTDINMPGLNGLALLEQARALRPGLQVIVMTGYATIESAVQSMKLGAAEFLQKPFLNEQVVAMVKKLETIVALQRENAVLREQLDEVHAFQNVVGSSKAMQDVFKALKQVSRSESNILITGETGTGKEVIARAIHNASARKDKALVAISCAAIPSTLLEDELFGHEKGAFTDARDRKVGRFERADGGTIFLDDIDDMPLETQVKLLRILQEREFERLGGEQTIKIDVRVVAATKVDLREHVREGKFREDLFYRLNVVPIKLPPLRDRGGDIPLLARHFIRKYGRDRDYEIKSDVLAAMEAYYWPGNVRELEHAIERAIAFAGSGRFLKKEYLVETSPIHKKAMAVPNHLMTLREFVEDAEKEHISNILRATNGHKAQAADVLGISRKNLWEKMRLYGIEANGGS
ncbi:MAG: sigma-54-dependent Fis family transcriptional regulator [Planctomycetes bacterium]|nr:sigma-54-dependent Fis family transcriptional regulator [Planctomycetota bacterium]